MTTSPRRPLLVKLLVKFLYVEFKQALKIMHHIIVHVVFTEWMTDCFFYKHKNKPVHILS